MVPGCAETPASLGSWHTQSVRIVQNDSKCCPKTHCLVCSHWQSISWSGCCATMKEGFQRTIILYIYIYIDISIFTHYLQWFLQPLYGFQTKGFWLSPSDSLWPRPSLRALKSSQVAWVFGTSRTQSIPQGWGPDWPSQRRPGKNRSPALTSTSGFLRSHQKVS